MTQYAEIRYDLPRPGVARITLARPEIRNAQNSAMLYEIDDALTAAGVDESVRVVVIAADGPDFSAGHNLTDLTGADLQVPESGPVVAQTTRGDKPGIEGQMEYECDAFLGLSLRWRDFAKPTIVAVQGRTIAAGLMLVWPFDIIIAAEDASFRDPLVAFGVNGHEYFTHPWEFGARKAKELLFTGDALTAQEAREIGMVNHVLPRAQLEQFTLDMAAKIATRPPFGLRLAKMSVNQALDMQGQPQAVRSAFSLHQIGHANNFHQHELLVIPDGPGIVRSEIKKAGQPPRYAARGDMPA